MEMFSFTSEENTAHQDDVPETTRLLMPAHGEATLETATPIPRHSCWRTTGGYRYGERVNACERLPRTMHWGGYGDEETCLKSTMALRCCKDNVVEKRCDKRCDNGSSIHEDAGQLCIQSQEFPLVMLQPMLYPSYPDRHLSSHPLP
jgi:hypothetical protein